MVNECSYYKGFSCITQLYYKIINDNCKRALILTLFVSVPIAQSEQLQQPKASQLRTVMNVLEVETWARTFWELAYGHGDTEYKPKSPEEVIANIDAWLKDERNGQIAE